MNMIGGPFMPAAAVEQGGAGRLGEVAVAQVVQVLTSQRQQ